MGDKTTTPLVSAEETGATAVTRRLIAMLSSEDLKAGDRLPAERVLAENLGVNRPTVREAIKSLAFLGLVDIRHGSGTYYRGHRSEVLYHLFESGLMTGEQGAKDMLEARAQLEILVAGLAAERANDNDVSVLRDRLEDMRGSTPKDFPEADVRFHLAIAEAARNSTLRDMLHGLRAVMQRGWVDRNVQAAATIRIAYRDHVPIFEAIERRDPTQARLAMSAHMTGATERLLNALSRGAGTATAGER